jgi:NADH:ubiquinone oxidoreductase subunit E
MNSEKSIEIVVCMGSSCFSRGNKANLDAVQRYLKQRGRKEIVNLVGSRCEEECMHGPNIYINGKRIQCVSPEAIPSIFDREFAAISEEAAS